MSKRTVFANLVLASMEDLNNMGDYRVQQEKEFLGAIMVGYDTDLATELSYYGVVKEPVALRFSGIDDTEYTNDYFTLQAGTAITRFDETTDLGSNPQYNGGERLRVSSSQSIAIRHNTLVDPNNYIFLAYVELKKNKKYDQSGVNAYFVDRQDAWILVQMTQAEAQSLGNFNTNPNGYVNALNITAPHLNALLTNDEKSYTFGSWSSPGGVFTVGSYRVTHYNSVFLGKVLTTGESPIKYKFYHTLLGADALYGVFSRPGLSIVDNAHRNRLGNGTQSDANPHAQALTDFDLYNETIVDHRNLHHGSGINIKFSTSLECVINGTTTPDSVTVTQLLSGEYLFFQGKRVTSVSPLTVTFSENPASGAYYIYVQPAGSATISPTSPYESYVGVVAKATSLPANAFLLCSVYYDQGTQTLKAYNGDPRYNASSTTNPVNDLRVFGLVSYDNIQSSILESTGKENLIINGNFELVENNVIKGWTNGTPGTILPADGNACLKIPSGGGSTSSLAFPIDGNVDYGFRIKSHTESTSSTYQINLFLYRGKNKVRDKVGSFVLNSGTINYSSWTLLEGEFLSTSSITWDGAFINRNEVGWGTIEIVSSSGILNLDSVVFRPKIRTVDVSNDQITEPKIGPDAVSARTINPDVAGIGLTQAGDGSLRVNPDETSLTVTGDTVAIKGGGVSTTHVDTASQIGRLVYNGTGYIDTGGNSIGYALALSFASGTHYIPAWNTSDGPGCGCTCTCTCTCTCQCTGTCECGGSWRFN